MQCKGRIVSDVKGVGALSFEGGGSFHIPIRCDRMASDLCEQCQKRKGRTDTKVADMSGISLQGTHPSYLHGRIGEPIPFWSHIYDGAWFRLKIASGAIVSSDTMARAKAAAAKANEGVAEVEPEVQPVKGGKKAAGAGKGAPKAKKGVAVAPSEAALSVATPVAAISVAVPAPAPAPAKPKRAKKAAAPEPLETIQPIALLQGKPLEVDNIVHISVKQVEIGQRSVYLDSKTQKVYDLKCKYIGRYDTEKECITSFPDSDED